MKRTLLLLSLTLTASIANNLSNSTETKIKVLTNDTMVIRETRTYREARCPRAVRQNRQSRADKKIARESRTKRVNRIAQYMVKKPTTHLACSK